MLQAYDVEPVIHEDNVFLMSDKIEEIEREIKSRKNQGLPQKPYKPH
jgi:hypothetical protein